MAAGFLEHDAIRGKGRNARECVGTHFWGFAGKLCRKKSHPLPQKAVLPIKKQVGREGAIGRKKETGSVSSAQALSSRPTLPSTNSPFPQDSPWLLDRRATHSQKSSVPEAHLPHSGQDSKEWEEENLPQTVWVCVPALPLTVLPLGKLHGHFTAQVSYLSTS